MAGYPADCSWFGDERMCVDPPVVSSSGHLLELLHMPKPIYCG